MRYAKRGGLRVNMAVVDTSFAQITLEGGKGAGSAAEFCVVICACASAAKQLGALSVAKCFASKGVIRVHTPKQSYASAA